MFSLFSKSIQSGGAQRKFSKISCFSAIIPVLLSSVQDGGTQGESMFFLITNALLPFLIVISWSFKSIHAGGVQGESTDVSIAIKLHQGLFSSISSLFSASIFEVTFISIGINPKSLAFLVFLIL